MHMTARGFARLVLLPTSGGGVSVVAYGFGGKGDPSRLSVDIPRTPAKPDTPEKCKNYDNLPDVFVGFRQQSKTLACGKQRFIVRATALSCRS